LQASVGLLFVLENKKFNPKEPLFQEANAFLKLNCRIFTCAKASRLIDRKPTSVDRSQLSDNPAKTRRRRLFEECCHISNIGSFTIDQARGFRAGQKVHF
jgi:hypothetical protein